MGEVWRARDTKLRRDVAIKVLPDAVAREPEHLSRFRREARALAALNHPNISAIYGLEEHDQIHFLVLELVEGDTISDLLAGGPLPITESLRIGAQITEALGAAHDKGIVHRDLKPANIKITPDGQVKVLDFGLAKAFSSETDADLSRALTVTETVGSRKGTFVGTPAYMSPEQARGQQVDKRTDTWAFGCVLFEMLAGRRSFAGVTLSDTIARVLERDPDWTGLPPETPARIRDLLERCLEKDVRNRQRDFGDVRIEIERALSEPVTPSHEVSAVSALPLNWVIAVVLVVSVTASVVTGLIVWNSRSPGLDAVSGPPRLENIRNVTSLPGNEDQPVLSPDGQFVTFVAETTGNRDIWIQQVQGGDPIQVTKDQADDFDPDWSPDGATIAFRSNRTNGGLYTIPALGGTATRIAEFGYRPRWSPDGSRISFQRRPSGRVPNDLFVMDHPQVSLPELVLGSGLGVGDVFGNSGFDADWSPDGRHLAYHSPEATVGLLPLADPENGWMLDFDGAMVNALGLGVNAFAAGLDPVWLPDGRGIIVSAGRQRLQYIALDSGLKAAAPPFQLTTGPGDRHPSISRNGQRIAYSSATVNRDIWKVELDLDTRQPVGNPIRVVDNPAGEITPVVLPDDEHILFLSNRNGQNDVYVADTNGENERLVDDTRSWVHIRSVSPDGKWIATMHRGETFLIPFDPVSLQKVGPPRSLGPGQPLNWSPEGKYLLMQGTPTYERAGIELIENLTSEEPKRIFFPFNPEFAEQYPGFSYGYFSPDGKRIAFGGLDTFGNPSIFVVETGSDSPEFIWEGSGYPKWFSDSDRVYIFSERGDETFGKLGFVSIDSETGKPDGDITFIDLELRRVSFSGSPARNSMTSDGRWLFVQGTEVEGDVWVADLVWN